MSGRGFIAAEPAQQCDLCSEMAELRPYGPNGECICWECAQTFPQDIINKRMAHHLFGDPL